MSIVTKKGDQGETGRFGGGRVPKADPRICAIGSVDELNSAIGLLSARADLSAEISHDLKTIQKACFAIGAQLSTPQDALQEAKDYIPRTTEDDVLFLDRKIDRIERNLSLQRRFLLPGGAPAAAICFWIRSIARRAEREVNKSSQTEPVDQEIFKYLNRISDYFYVLARFLNQESGAKEVEWQGGHKR